MFNKDLIEEHNPMIINQILQHAPATVSLDEFNHYIKGMTTTNNINVKYNPRHGIGRRYPESASEPLLANGVVNPFYGKYYGGLITLPRIIKNTIFKYANWIDLDISKCHPSIIYSIAEKTGIPLTGYKQYLENFETICSELIELYSADDKNPLTKKHIKQLFTRTIYGGSFVGWVKDIEQHIPLKNLNYEYDKYQTFYKDTQFIINKIYDNNVALNNVVADKDNSLQENKNRTMSYWCGIIENHITYQACKFLQKIQVISPNKFSWGYDGITFKNNHNFKDNHTIDLLNDEIQQKCNLPHVKFIIKPFDEYIELPITIDNPLSSTLTKEEPDIETDTYLEWKQDFEVYWCKIINSAIFVKTQFDENNVFQSYVFMNKTQLLTAYQHETYTTINRETGMISNKSMVSKWLDDRNMRIYTEMQVIPPPRFCPKTTFNLWRPFKYLDQPISSDDPNFDKEAVEAFANHLQIMCDHNQAVFIYLCNWIAHMFQKPAQKPECCINFIGNQGTGKSSIPRIISDMMGPGYKIETSTPERDVWGSFNGQMLHAYLVVLSETDKRNLKENGTKQLKKLITDNSSDSGFIINMKGKDQFGINSFHRVMQDTNKRDPLETSEDDRRNLVIKCSDELKNNNEYFNKLNSIMNKPFALRSLFWSFYTMEIADWNFRQIPRTEYHNTINEGNTNPYVLFMEYFTHYYNEQSPDEVVELFGKEVYDIFNRWRTENGYKFLENISESILLRNILLEMPEMKEYMPKTKRSKLGQARSYNISRLRDYFKIEPIDNYGTDTEDDTRV